MPGTPVSAVAISSVIPSAKKSCATSPELFSRGSTATMGRPDAGACADAVESATQSVSSDATVTRKHSRIRSDEILPICPPSEPVKHLRPHPEERRIFAARLKDGSEQPKSAVADFGD